MARPRPARKKRTGFSKGKTTRAQASTGAEEVKSGGESRQNQPDDVTTLEKDTPAVQDTEEFLDDDDVPPDADADIVFQCASCRSVVGDTRSEYQAHLEYETLSLKAASNVTVEKDLHISKKGFDSGCTYRRVMCSQCGEHLGRTYTSTTVEFDSLRSAYTFMHTALVSYQLGCSKTIDGHYAPNADKQAQSQPPKLDETSQGVSAEAFDALDAHVSTITDSTNKLTEAFNHNKESINELKQALEHTHESLDEQRGNLEHVQNMLLLWEERFQRLQACEQSVAKLADDCQKYEDGERRVSQLEEIVRRSKLIGNTASGSRPQSAPMKVMQSIRKSSSSPARSSLKRRRH